MSMSYACRLTRLCDNKHCEQELLFTNLIHFPGSFKDHVNKYEGRVQVLPKIMSRNTRTVTYSPVTKCKKLVHPGKILEVKVHFHHSYIRSVVKNPLKVKSVSKVRRFGSHFETMRLIDYESLNTQ